MMKGGSYNGNEEKLHRTNESILTPKGTMLGVWWDWRGLVYYDLLLPNKIIAAGVYCQQLTKLYQTIKRN